MKLNGTTLPLREPDTLDDPTQDLLQETLDQCATDVQQIDMEREALLERMQAIIH